MITSFRDQVRNYLRRSGRSQAWLLERLEDYGITLAPSSLSLKLSGDRGFKEVEISIIRIIMKNYK